MNTPHILTQGLTMDEAAALKQVRQLLLKKPEAVLKYLSGQVGNDNKALIALALSAQLNHSKMQLESMQLTKALVEHVVNLNKGATTQVRDLLTRAADKLDDYCTEVNGDMNDSLASEITAYIEKERKDETPDN